VSYSGSGEVRSIGPHDGTRLVKPGPESIDVIVDAAENWKVEMYPVPSGGTSSVYGRGDMVGAFFEPAPNSTWNIVFDGFGENTARLHCGQADLPVAHSHGPSTARLSFSLINGPCFWELIGDGDWSVSPGL